MARDLLVSSQIVSLLSGPTKHRIGRIERIGRQGTVVVLRPTICSRRCT